MSLKDKIKNYAYELGADLVGLGNVERCKHAPIMMSPQGVFPGSKTVIVMGIHHPDACIELGGESHPQEIGPYSVQYLMNSRLDELSYRMATFMEKQGYGAIPICSSNIWRYNQYKSLNAIFSPDVSNIYMPVVAGLADMGYNGLALTPEYGARNRFVTIITDAEIDPDPLLEPGALCDKCMLCRKHCPSQALSKEISGEKVLKIEDKEYRFADKNLWRCAWGEHFDLDLDLDLPEKVTEEVIIEYAEKYGTRGGEMGQCLKFCIPKKIRTFDRSYSKTPMREYCVSWNENLESRAINDKLITDCYAKDIEHVVVQSAEKLKAKGIDIETMLPGATTAISLIRTHSKDENNKREKYTSASFQSATIYHINSVCYDLTRDIEAYGFRSLMTITSSGSHYEPMTAATVNTQIAKDLFKNTDCEYYINTVYTRKTLPERRLNLSIGRGGISRKLKSPASLTEMIKDYAKDVGADLCGVASTERISMIAKQLKPHFNGYKYLNGKDKSTAFKLYDPIVTKKSIRVYTAKDYLPEAKSVIVIGLRYHQKVLEFATKPPAEAVGPYAFQTYVTAWQGDLIASKIIQKLKHMGYKAVISNDLMGLGSEIASPRRFIEDAFTNRFAAVAAGLGSLAESGRVVTDEFGTRQRFIAIVTDAELKVDKLVKHAPELCRNCDKFCIKTCPTGAMSSEKITFKCDDVTSSFNWRDINLCDWSKRYALMGKSGFKYLGSDIDENPNGKVTSEKLEKALKKYDPIKKARPVAAEPCMLNCPYSSKD